MDIFSLQDSLYTSSLFGLPLREQIHKFIRPYLEVSFKNIHRIDDPWGL